MGYNEINLILNEGTKKSVPEIYMTKKGLDLWHKYKWEEHQVERTGYLIDQCRDEWEKYRRALDDYNASYTEGVGDDIYGTVHNEYIYMKGKPREPKTNAQVTQADYEKYKNWKWLGRGKYSPDMDSFLFRYYNIKQFEPWVMLNVSPDRAGTKIIKADICKFKRAFGNYMKEEWYEEWYVTFETGGNGDHLHLHAVCKMGSRMKKLKSVRTHIAKGNWKRQFMKHCKAEGFEGVKNQGCQAIIIQGENGEELLEDKKKYLIEEEKPIGHKNKTPNTLKGDWVINKRCYGSL